MDNQKPIVLAIDDQPVILHTVASELRELYLVKPFTSGQIALKYLSAGTASLILLDYEMPGMNGVQVLEKLKENEKTRDIPVIILTGSEDEAVEAQVLKCGASGFLRKPIESDRLKERVESWLNPGF